MRHVVIQADRKVDLRLLRVHIAEDRMNRSGRYVFRRQAVATGVNFRMQIRMANSGADIFIKRFAEGARFLRAIHDRDLLHRLRQGRHEVFQREGAIKVNLHIARLLALRVQGVHRFLNRACNGTHGDDDRFRIGCAVIVEKLIFAPCEHADLLHVFIDDLRQPVVPEVARFFGLKVHVRIRYGTAHDRVFRIEAGMFELIKRVFVDEFFQFFFRQHGNFLNFMGRAEAVKEMHKRHMSLNGRQMGYGSKIGAFLNACAAKHGKARIATAHDVGMIAENGHGMGPDRTGRNMQDDRLQLTGQAVQYGDHEHEPLRRRKSRTETARFGRTVNGTDGTRFGLHFHEFDGLAEEVLAAVCRPGINVFRHRR